MTRQCQKNLMRKWVNQDNSRGAVAWWMSSKLWWPQTQSWILNKNRSMTKQRERWNNMYAKTRKQSNKSVNNRAKNSLLSAKSLVKLQSMIMNNLMTLNYPMIKTCSSKNSQRIRHSILWPLMLHITMLDGLSLNRSLQRSICWIRLKCGVQLTSLDTHAVL